MPKAHEENGFVFSFYSNDHLPMHVHAKKGGAECVFLLGEMREIEDEFGETILEVVIAPSIRENNDMSPADVRRALNIVAVNQARMLARWREHFEQMRRIKMTLEEFESQLEAANRRGLEAQVGEVRAVSVRFDQKTNELVLGLRGGLTLLIPVHLLQGVAGKAPELIEQVELAANGSALHFELLDADFAIQSLAAGSFGTAKWMQVLEDAGLLDPSSIERRRALANLQILTAADMGRKGGSARTQTKSAASRANGIKGGRPRKMPIAA